MAIGVRRPAWTHGRPLWDFYWNAPLYAVIAGDIAGNGPEYFWHTVVRLRLTGVANVSD